jgi:hypothetical protein
VGETQSQPFQLSFNGSLKVEFQGSRVTSDAGLILVRELDEHLGFSGLIEQPAAAGGGPALREGVPPRGVVPPCALHRDQPGDGPSSRGAFLQQTGHGGGRRGDTRPLLASMLCKIAGLPSPAG